MNGITGGGDAHLDGRAVVVTGAALRHRRRDRRDVR